MAHPEEIRMINDFKSNPYNLLHPQYELWNTTSFLNTHVIFNYLNKYEPDYPLLNDVGKTMIGYVKFCCDNNLFFPWNTEGGKTKNQVKEEFLALYNRVI